VKLIIGMKPLLLFFILLILLAKANSKSIKLNFNDANGGIPCATCTAIIGVVEQLALVYNTTIDVALNKFCNYLPSGLFRFTCQQAADLFSSVIISGFYLKQTPDVICHALKICRTDPGQPECRLFPKPNVKIK
jgi:acyloxyacyl hydrolase